MKKLNANSLIKSAMVNYDEVSGNNAPFYDEQKYSFETYLF